MPTFNTTDPKPGYVYDAAARLGHRGRPARNYGGRERTINSISSKTRAR